MCGQTIWCGQATCKRKFISGLIAEGFDKVIMAAFPEGDVSMMIVASAYAASMSRWSNPLSTVDRVLVLNEMVEDIIANHRDHPDTELLQH